MTIRIRAALLLLSGPCCVGASVAQASPALRPVRGVADPQLVHQQAVSSRRLAGERHHSPTSTTNFGHTPLARRAPNVLLILADDLGFADLGCYGGEISTPNLDRLAAGGLRFTQFYNCGRCWPTRAALLTGYYAQQVRRDKLPGVRSGAGGLRPTWGRLLPEMLRPLGYRSYLAGKWHVDGRPNACGFDRSYRVDDHDRYFGPRRHSQDGERLAPVADPSFYLTQAIADRAIAFLQDHAAAHADRPFFCLLTFTAPHFPLQAPAADVARYRQTFASGWDEVRSARFGRQKALGLLDCRMPPIEREVGPPYAFPEALRKLGSAEVNRPRPWSRLGDAQRAFQADKMAVHAAMVDRMDREIGRVLTQLRRMRAFDDTLILFLSDNGASAEIMVRGDGHDPRAAPGSAGSFLCLGPGWSSAANTPFRRHKTWVHEGGIATPLIVHWPGGIAARGALRRTPGHVVDLVPTILARCGGSPPATAMAPPRPGRDLSPAFADDCVVARESLWWSHDGHRALRVGDLKWVVARGEPAQLFDLAVDRAEAHDLAAAQPQRVRAMAAEWQAQEDAFRAALPERRVRRP
ncbi:MAG: arylsulfatase [Planctomycetes bacterium]|nr:arylsulfatase [Planctomycetota bacterium]